jgi:chromosome segregation ATPase
MYPILDMKDSIKDIMCIGYEITEEVMLERDKNKKIISTKTNFVQKTKDKEAIIQKELNDTKAQLEKAIEVVEYLKRQNSELIKKTNSNGYESEINRLIQENTELRKNLRASESKLKSQQLDMVRKEKVLNEKANNLYVKNVDLTGRNEKLQNDLKKSKTELQKLSNTINNNRKTLTVDTKLKDHLPTYRDRDKDVKMKGNALKAMFK